MKRNCCVFSLKLVLLLCMMISCLAKEGTRNISTDQAALLAFKNHITSDPHQLLAKNWSASFSVCDWIGVTCGVSHGRVVALNVSNMGLAGTIPPHLGNLSFVVSLNLTNNYFHGNLPSELGHLRRLRIFIAKSNDLDGDFPLWFGSLTELRTLSLAGNSFSGLIPSSLSNLTKLESLYLSNNSMERTVPVEIGSLHSLKSLIIDRNKLSDSLPKEIFNISTLEVIGVMRNFLSGDLPNDVCSHTPRVAFLGFDYNNFSGQIPRNLSQCSKLRNLGLSYNSFDGSFVPKEVGSLENLQKLFLDQCNLKGAIPKEIGNLTALQVLSLSENNLTGEIPSELGKLYSLVDFQLRNNYLRGQIPMGVLNLSEIRKIILNVNLLEGQLSFGMSYAALPNLQVLALAANLFTGVITSSISNCSKLVIIELSTNNFEGCIPYTLGQLNNLQILNVAQNRLTCKSSSQELDFFAFLSSCKVLKLIWVDVNPIDGFLPTSIGNLSKSVENIVFANCNIRGSIPSEIGNLSSLIYLSTAGNQLTGSIPSTVQGLSNIQSLNLANNKLSGDIPKGICSLQQLNTLSLEANDISGSIPDCLGNISSLRNLFMGFNKLNSEIPTNLMNIKDLLILNLSSNFITGPLPLTLGNLKVATQIDLSMNNLTGDIPSTVADLKNLELFSLAHNVLQGSIPESIDEALNLQYLDLSHNNLSGIIPKSLENLQYLNYLNVSFNQLRGEIPLGGRFQNFTRDSFAFNEALCGSPNFNVPPCPNAQIDKSKKRKAVRLIVFVLIGGAAIVGFLMLGVYIRYRKKQKVLPKGNTLPLAALERISYYELQHATNNYAESNLLGAGTFGTVYKGNLSGGRVVAVKVFNLLVEGACKSFEVECQVLRNLRHRNLTKVISSCCNPDFKALVLEFIPNGSLEKWLYSHNNFLDIKQRLNIMIDVAQALQYLHSGNSTPVIHCDLKPSNILVDENLVGRVSDFGIAKLFDQEQSNRYTETIATFGYVAPEYGLEGLVSTRSDVYSYGILLMEVFSRKSPTDEMFYENFSLRDWVNNSIADVPFELIDANLLQTSNEFYTEIVKCSSYIFEVALRCSEKSPKNRMNMEEVLAALNKIKLQLQRCQTPRQSPKASSGHP